MSSSVIRVKNLIYGNGRCFKDSGCDLNWVWIASFSGLQAYHAYPYDPEGYAFCCSEPREAAQCSSIALGPQLRVGRIETAIWKSSEFPSAVTLPSPVNCARLFLTHPPSPVPTHPATSSVFFGVISAIILTFPLLPITHTTAIQVGSMKQGRESQWPISHLSF